MILKEVIRSKNKNQIIRTHPSNLQSARRQGARNRWQPPRHKPTKLSIRRRFFKSAVDGHTPVVLAVYKTRARNGTNLSLNRHSEKVCLW